MKICFINFGFYPQSSLAAFYEYTQSLSKVGNNVTVYCREEGTDISEMRGNITVKALCPNIHLTKYARLIFLSKLVFSLRKEKYDIVHIFWGMGVFILPLLVGRKHTKWVLDIRNCDIHGGIKGMFRDKMAVYESYFFDSVAVLSELLRRRLFGDRYLKSMVIFPIGVNLERFKFYKKDESILKKLGIGSEERVLVYSGKLSPSRKLETVLHGFQRASRDIKNMILLIVGGSEDDVTRLKNIAKRLSIDDKVIFTGLVSYRDVPKYLSVADAGIAYVPKTEVYDVQVPLKTIEYLACSLPSVVSNTSGNKECVVNGHNGLLCSDNPESLGKAIVKLLNDADLYNSIKNNARKSIAQYDWGIIVRDQLIPLYQKLTSE
ncbi:MAG TPA: glycosyltransferase family 1 protein [Nitrospirae bacterium]|nr:GDP-mannose-dependent alpha-(1-6)-phosphatidylinositol monomannoside mannosyltransferase [bacterium BMS3Abin06]HDH13263.1 glycosyltransferase family 1 protein [Nitrospirota bacterium]HDZ01769.1 glycosyltransferase family 1 protein [Nitrospirota bacterium]